MPNAKDYSPASAGILAGGAGPPGTGKSTMILSMTEVGKTVVALTEASELDLYAGHDIEYELFTDPGWQPTKQQFNAADFTKLIQWIDTVSKRSDVRCIGVDHTSGGTSSPGVSDLAMQEVLKIHRVGNPLDLPHGAPYFGHIVKLREFLGALRLAASRGKHVYATTLVELRESEADPKSGKNEFEERLLPAMHGKIRQSWAASFSLFLYHYTLGERHGTRWLVTALPDKHRPAKKRLHFKEGVDSTQLPNNWKALLEVLA